MMEISNLSQFSIFFFVYVLILNLSGHGQFPVSMETERVSAESHDQNFIEKVHLFSHMREREVEVKPKTECVWCNIYHFYQLAAKSVMRKGEGRDVKNRFHIIKVKVSVCAGIIDQTLKSSVSLNY